VQHSANEELDRKLYRVLIAACLEVADISKDRSYSKLAYNINPLATMGILRERISHFRNHFPYDALITRYIDICVARKDQRTQRVSIFNEFDVNRDETVKRIVDALLPTLEEERQQLTRKRTARGNGDTDVEPENDDKFVRLHTNVQV